MSKACLGIALLLAATRIFAEEPAAPRDPQNDMPWPAGREIRPGDQWARVLLDLDEHGWPERCRIARTNIRYNRTLRFHICQGFMGGIYRTEPVRQNGVAVRGTVERTIFLPGRASRQAYEQARRRQRAERRAEHRTDD